VATARKLSVKLVAAILWKVKETAETDARRYGHCASKQPSIRIFKEIQLHRDKWSSGSCCFLGLCGGLCRRSAGRFRAVVRQAKATKDNGMNLENSTDEERMEGGGVDERLSKVKATSCHSRQESD